MKITQRAIAALIPYSQQYVSQHWKLLQTLLKSPNNKTSQNSESKSNEIIAGVASALEAAIGGCEAPAQVLETVSDIFYGWLEPVQWAEIWEELSGKVQTTILTALTLTLPPDQIESLLQESGEINLNCNSVALTSESC